MYNFQFLATLSSGYPTFSNIKNQLGFQFEALVLKIYDFINNETLN